MEMVEEEMACTMKLVDPGQRKQPSTKIPKASKERRSRLSRRHQDFTRRGHLLKGNQRGSQRRPRQRKQPNPKHRKGELQLEATMTTTQETALASPPSPRAARNLVASTVAGCNRVAAAISNFHRHTNEKKTGKNPT
uniref:Uncharacterized protein n=1 Tax=Oryza barthii TaxID=65489 RepID=A0A0D3EML0_9ORYZ